MKESSNWRDYQIIASGDGQKLEMWGDVYLLRPDPQAIWSPPYDMAKFRMMHAKYNRAGTGGGAWEVFKSIPPEWVIAYEPLNLKFIISPTGFKHTGLFPEQAINWEAATYLIQKAIQSDGNQPTVLNLFGYTGGATAASAKAGAHVTHVDASRGMTDVCKRNVTLNEIPPDGVRYIVEDCAKFVARELRRGKTYDAIIMDPPSFGRGAGGEVWKIEQHLDDLVYNCCKLLSDKPLFFLINSYTTGLQPSVIKNILLTNLRRTKKDGIIKHVEAYEVGVPTREGFNLPSGCSAIAVFRISPS